MLDEFNNDVEAGSFMTDAGARKLAKDGWTIVEDDGFLNLVGPFWHRGNNTTGEYAIVAQQKHRNRRGFVQGGC